MIEKLVTRNEYGEIASVIERTLPLAEEAAAETWLRVKRDVLPAVRPPDGRADARVAVPVAIDPPELAEAFGRELGRLAARDAGAWSAAWAGIDFTVNGGGGPAFTFPAEAAAPVPDPLDPAAEAVAVDGAPVDG
jgi:hypothetical protein